MVKGISDSDVKRLLEEIASTYNCKIWVAERIGRRWSYVDGLKAGKEFFLPAELIYECDDFGIFVEGLESSYRGAVVEKLDRYFRGRGEVEKKLHDTGKSEE